MKISIPSKAHFSARGALMAAALLLMLASGMFLSAWVSLVSTRGAQLSFLETILQRRLAVENSRLMAWEVGMEKGVLPNATLTANKEGILGTSYGGINSDDGWSSINPFSSTRTPGNMTTVFPYNYTSLRPAVSYLTSEKLKRATVLTDVDDFTNHLFMKTFPGVLAGDLLTYYRKPTTPAYRSVQIEVVNTPSSNTHWLVDGRIVIRDNSSFFARTTPSPMHFSSRSRSIYVQSHDAYNARAIRGTKFDGTNLRPSNLPAIPTTTGPVSTSDSDRYLGYLNVVKNDLNTSNSLWHFMDREKTAGRSDFALIDVYSSAAPDTDPFWMDRYSGVDGDVPIYRPVDYSNESVRTLYVRLNHPNLKHLRITNPVEQIVFIGQNTNAEFESAGEMTPIIISIVQGDSTPLPNIAFVGDNNRRFVLGLKVNQPLTRGLYLHWTGSPRTFSPTGDHDWRMVYINEGQFTMLKLPDTRNVRWIGGIMTNWTIKRYGPDGDVAERLRIVSDASVPTASSPVPSFASLLPRDAWLESYFVPTPPDP